ncbi:hypothetical protein [Stutzerimonas stutzeri]|uniref:hypothetical protein n=1 Tax=Stutzerimonas stutzeri TaxID=316 RepID=UPI000838C977|nr:hypothetical protein [Stutzerimonas stutzeri]OCX57180.1 hypothetical protein BFM99_14010 [Stutzerimonas stutzeri]
MGIHVIEQEMRRALFGASAVVSARQLIERQASPAITVTLSVRRDGGTIKRFEKTVKTLSRLEAEIEAKKAARAEGWTVWCVLEVAGHDVEELTEDYNRRMNRRC